MGNTGVVSLVDRRVLGRRRGAAAVLVAVLAVASGVTMAMVAGGRRAATSYDRFVAWAGGPDAMAFGFPQGAGIDSATADGMLTRLAAMPEVEQSARTVVVGAGITLPSGEMLPVPTVYPSVGNAHASVLGSVKVLHGRLPDNDAPDELVVGFQVAEQYHLHAGDSLGLVVDGDTGRSLPLRLVGVIAQATGFPSLAGRADSSFMVTEALTRQHPELVDWTNAGLVVRLRDGVTADDFRAAVGATGIPIGVGAREDGRPGVNRFMRVQAGLLWVLAAIFAGSALVVVAQLARRDTAAVAPDLAITRMLGARRADLVGAGARRGARSGVVSALVATGLAIALSPVFPLGVARTADPHPGLHADSVVLTIGAALTILVGTALGVGAVLLSTRKPRPVSARVPITGRFAGHLPPTPAVGARLATQPGSPGSPAGRFGLLGLTTIVALLFAAFAARASFDHVFADPSLSGATWDVMLHWDDASSRGDAAARIAADPSVSAFARGDWSDVSVNGQDVYAMVVEPGAAVRAATDRGRAPISSEEIALGAAEMRSLHVGLGDTVDVSLLADDGTPLAAPVKARVVGRTVLAAPVFADLGQGRGGAITPELFSRVGGEDPGGYFVRLRDRDDVRVGGAALEERLGPDFSFPRSDRSGISSLRDLRRMPDALILLLLALAAVALVHRLVTTARARRRDVAVLRSLGLTGGQVVGAGVVQGALVGGLALVVAAPAGVFVALVAWRWVAGYLSVVPHLVVQIAAGAGVVGGLLVAGAGLGTAVAWRARRLAPGGVLRQE